MADVSTAPGIPPQPRSPDRLSTLRDPRILADSPSLSRSQSIASQHPDFNNEVAALSNKLISAINHQTHLDDSLAATRHELASTRERMRRLEGEAQEHTNLIASGTLIQRSFHEDEVTNLRAQLAQEKQKRLVAEKEKKGIEQELETLTTALFEEANQMVSAARKDHETTERRNDVLRAQLNDTELLLASHQEQLAELKSVMQQMSLDRDEADSNTNSSTAPSTPAMQSQDHENQMFVDLHASPTTLPQESIAPAPPTTFTHLLQPVLRTDLQSYNDFHALLQTSRHSPPPSRLSSGSYGSLNIVGLSNISTREHSQISGHIASDGSTTSQSTIANHSIPTTPNTPASTNSSVSSRDPPSFQAPLKETRFYKRVLTEDIEPTLRLDTAPGLSWLARRTVVNSICEGSLVVEPMPATIKSHIFSCSLCGEHRQGTEFGRSHRFRTSENDNAQKYPLCLYCLNRVRACCEFLGFLRMVRDGHWRTDGVEAEKNAWEESVRLREHMFWARIGGGVVPLLHHARDSPRTSADDIKVAAMGREISHITSATAYDNQDPFGSDQKRISPGKPISARPKVSLAKSVLASDSYPVDTTPLSNGDLDAAAAMKPQTSHLKSVKLGSSIPAHEVERPTLPQHNSDQRLSVTIPGSFDF